MHDCVWCDVKTTWIHFTELLNLPRFCSLKFHVRLQKILRKMASPPTKFIDKTLSSTCKVLFTFSPLRNAFPQLTSLSIFDKLSYELVCLRMHRTHNTCSLAYTCKKAMECDLTSGVLRWLQYDTQCSVNKETCAWYWQYYFYRYRGRRNVSFGGGGRGPGGETKKGHYRVYQKKLDTLVKPSQIIILWYKYESCSWICSLGSTQSDDIMSNDNISRLSEHWPF